MNSPQLSYYTTCRNRLGSLISTLPHNLKLCRYLPVEFVLIDYGSTEDVSGFLKSLPPELTSNLRAYRTEAEFFRFGHAKNVAARQTYGGMICNLDADDFLVPGMFEFLTSTLEGRTFIAPPDTRFYGRIAFQSVDFESLGGYDERFDGYGYEDTDLVHRAESSGFYRIHWPFTRFEIVQPHSEHGKCTKEPSEVTIVKQRELAEQNIANRVTCVNLGVDWGAASLTEIITCPANS